MTTAPGRQPYTWETEGHIVVHTPANLKGKTLRFQATWQDQIVVPEQPITPGLRQAFPLSLAPLPTGSSELTCQLREDGRVLETTLTQITRLAEKPHTVKLDYRRRGLCVDDRPFLPFGFYCELPLRGLPDDEVIHGFNIIAPYRSGPATETEQSLAETRSYLDRCAAIGMKVVYDLRPVAERPPSDEKWAKLQEEIEAFRDHPAVLCWIISDEPADKKIDPELLAETRAFIRKHDLYHPVTIVFCHHALVHRYLAAMDFVLLDYYPIPNHPVSHVALMINAMDRAVGSLMPMAFVPQAFGGSWMWSREPSAREQRVMTYLALLHGARGIQYFIRRPPNENPISPLLWSECRRLAMEAAELAPALLSDQTPPQTQCAPATVHTAAYLDRGYCTVVAVNTENRPEVMRLQIEGMPYDGPAEVLFENRQIEIKSGMIEEMVDAFGTRAYRFPTPDRKPDSITIDPRNLTVNPSFEQTANVGIPDGCYVGRGDPAATLFVDSQVARHGLHSIRLTAPTPGGGLRYSASPIPIEKDTRYQVSVWGRAATPGLALKISFPWLGIDEQTFALTQDWQEFTLTGTGKQTTQREAVLGLRLAGTAGTAWLDLLQVIPMETPATQPTPGDKTTP